MNPLPSLFVAHVYIRQDEQGRYCLNDLHKAAGGEARHRPSLWLANKQAKEVIAELEAEAKSQSTNSCSGISPTNIKSKAGIPALPVAFQRGGENEKRGTFVTRELVYIYAMWISAKFHLVVIRAADAALTGELSAQQKILKQVEAAYFARYPERREIRRLAYQGEPYWYIGERVRRAAATVGKAVRHMCLWGVMKTGLLAESRRTSYLFAKLRRDQRASRQLMFRF
ncbi:MAG: KilA-N domain-containing protein [Zoogloeaceae bacterium]|jgi:hypothetical protein|nr:KilA-N domain-containing protein [Zoogloeaceae bacterium]